MKIILIILIICVNIDLFTACKWERRRKILAADEQADEQSTDILSDAYSYLLDRLNKTARLTKEQMDVIKFPLELIRNPKLVEMVNVFDLSNAEDHSFRKLPGVKNTLDRVLPSVKGCKPVIGLQCAARIGESLKICSGGDDLTKCLIEVTTKGEGCGKCVCWVLDYFGMKC